MEDPSIPHPPVVASIGLVQDLTLARPRGLVVMVEKQRGKVVVRGPEALPIHIPPSDHGTARSLALALGAETAVLAVAVEAGVLRVSVIAVGVDLGIGIGGVGHRATHATAKDEVHDTGDGRALAALHVSLALPRKHDLAVFRLVHLLSGMPS